ncbi:class I SAM-dependent methyltransferase [Mycobacterium sp.]|nr:class I SAM-dependent methyltransferase [Mycobacterium sp.]
MDWDDLYKDRSFRLHDPNDEAVVFAHYLDKVKPAPSVLDVGFGAGRHIVYLAKRGYPMYGIDISPRGMDFTHRWLADEGLRAELQLADMRSLPFSEGFFGAALSIGVITHAAIEDVRLALGEMARVLRPGGLFLCTFISTESSLVGKGQRLDDSTWICDDESESGVIHHFMTGDEVLAEVSPYFEPVRLPALKHVRHGGEIDTGRPYVSAHWVYLGRRKEATGS